MINAVTPALWIVWRGQLLRVLSRTPRSLCMFHVKHRQKHRGIRDRAAAVRLAPRRLAGGAAGDPSASRARDRSATQFLGFASAVRMFHVKHRQDY